VVTLMHGSLRLHIVALLSWGALWLSLPGICRAQYTLPYDRDTTRTKDTTETADTTTIKSSAPRESDAVEEQAAKPAENPEKIAVEQAITWLRRLLYRGKLDVSVIGAYAQYQVTAWGENVGSFGPVEGRLTISYLGTSPFMGKNAEWLQAAFQAVEEEPIIVEFDLLLPSVPRVADVYRALYRVNRGETKALELNLPPNQIDYDREDRPAAETTEELKLYAGTFVCERFRGAGTEGAGVVIYRSDNVKPMNVVRLGYGDEGLTYTGGGNDAEPRFVVPSPR
jgi:hypothetical protein